MWVRSQANWQREGCNSMSRVYTPAYSGNPDDFGKTLVLYGGRSSEREISLLSGERVFEAMQELKVKASKLDIGENAIDEIRKLKPETVFIALHGAGGEDGKIQAVLDYLNIQYTGSGHAASALAMDKLRTKQVWTALGLPTPAYEVVDENSSWSSVLERLGGEVFVKPDHEGSSIGMSCAKNEEELRTAWELASGYDSSVLVERKITGAEYSVTILGNRALAPIRLQPKNTFYDYEAKYLSDETEYLCPCGLSEEKEAELRSLCAQAFIAIGCSGWGRVDVMADRNENFYLLEVNTVPGMTTHSLVPMAAKQEGLDFKSLVAEILTLSLKKAV